MASWSEVESLEPEFAARVRSCLDSHVHKTIATLRRDGAPRISGIETIWSAGELWFGSMPRAIKALDLLRDPRFALHSGSEDPPGWKGDAKLAGRAAEVSDLELIGSVLADRPRQEGEPEQDDESEEDPEPPEPGSVHLFRAELEEVVWTGLNDDRDRLIVESWHHGRGLERIER